MLRYPGRVLPFVTMNPKRDAETFGSDNAFSIMRKAIEDMGFVGVKLYPTMGHKLEEIAAAHDDHDTFFEFVSNRKLPITMHTSPEMGAKKHRLYCQPDLWKGYLRDYPGFRINYAHFGGSTCFWPLADKKRKPLHAGWKDRILEMMQDSQYGHRVFADVSYHDDLLSNPSKTNRLNNYLQELKKILNKTGTRRGVLFGSDYFLILLEGEETTFIDRFKAGVSASHFQITSETNPRRFLGFDDDDGAPNMGWNIKNFIEKLREAKESNHPAWAQGAPPAQWLNGLL